MNLTIVVECCVDYGQAAAKLLILWRTLRDDFRTFAAL
jgi:hypothetical protein